MEERKEMNSLEEVGVEEFVTTASDEPGSRSITVRYDFGASLEESVNKFGADVVHGMFIKAAKIPLQRMIRKMLNAVPAYSDEEIREAVAEWSPGVRQSSRGVSEGKVAKLLKQLESLPEDRKKAIIEKLLG